MRLFTPLFTPPQLGRFTLRDEGKTIGIGKIVDCTLAAAPAADGD